ncbi:hypothetical protein INS49_008690 [Diaporthe citri]|uniref:uncharacterized protein n=1 Tax=Diaporthe citri TaxID=83186 RepID=UPI001C81AE1E|nr:uncharacterized protein INS49_008690 [Diaporthe citri]KAG6363589.1 hypothetical protein INS49_008690 [Diaporthe citri]
MAPHTRFKLAVIRTMRCDFCNDGNVDGVQECQDCNVHFCRKCVESGKLDNDERHRMQQKAIIKLNWAKPPKGRRAAHHRETAASKPLSHDRPSKEQRLEARRAERRLRHEARHIGRHHESAPHFQASQDPRTQQPMGAFPGNGFNIPASHHEHVGHGQFQYVSAPPGYPPGYASSPPGYAPSLPAHAMPYGAPSAGPGQHGQHVQHPGYGGGLAMPSGPIYGHHFSVNPGLPPRGDPRLHTPPGQPYPYGGHPVPNNFGGYYGGGPPEYTAAPTPPGFPGPGFHQPPSQPQPMYNDRGYVSRGNMPTGQPVSGPGHASGHAFGQPYGGGSFSHAQSPHERQPQPRGQERVPAAGGEAPNFAAPAREARAREPTSQGHTEQPVNSLTIQQQQQQQQAWEQEQARQAWEQEQARQAWERQQAQQALQQMWERSQQQAIQQNTQPVAQQWQSQEGQQRRVQPEVDQASQTPQQAQKQDEQRQERREEQQSQQQAVRPISKGGAVSGAPPSTGPPFTLPPIVFAPHVTAPPITLPPITAPPVTAPPITTSPIAVSGFQQTRLPVLAPAPAPTPAPRPSAPEPDTTSQSGQVQHRETCIAPTVVEHAQRPFGIPAFARDLYAGRPNHYDETVARWAQSQPVRAKQIREYDEDDYDDDDNDDDDDDDATGTGLDTARPGCPPSGQPPSRGRKRAHSQVSSIDSTLSAELDPGQPEPDTTEERLQELLNNGDIAREQLEGGERAALDMAAAANTLQGGGRGLIGATGALCMANDVVIRRRQEEFDRKRQEEERHAAELVEKKGREGGGGSGGVGGSGSGDEGSQ